MDRPLRDSYVTHIDAELTQNILPYWINHVVDRERGGFHGEISHDGVVDKNAIRGMLLTARILWTFSSAYRHYSNPAYLEMARWAYRDLTDRFWDQEHGGLFWSIAADGTPLKMRKQVYGLAFGIYALSEFHRITGEAEPLERAISLFRSIDDHSRDPQHGGYFEAYTRDWQLEQDARLSAIDMNEPKSQNTHLHIMEAYTNLLRVWPDPYLKMRQAELVDIMLTRILNPVTHHLGLFFDEAWRPRSDRISFGHDIEASWLLTEAADVLADQTGLARVRPIAVKIAQVTLDVALDPDGGLLYEADPRGFTNTIKEWWPQAEAAVGFLNAYQLSGQETFLRAALRVWDFIATHLVDKKNGEWFRYVTREGSVGQDQAKVSFWKCPYHNGRACLELIDRLNGLD